MATPAQIKASAARGGYTKAVIIEHGDADIYAWAKTGETFAHDFTTIDQEGGTIRNWSAEDEDVNVRELDQ